MAKHVEFWSCDKCNNTHETEELAQDCEKKHPLNNEFEVIGSSFNIAGKYGPMLGSAQIWPNQIKVKNKVLDNNGVASGWNWAFYELKQIGPNGV